MNAEIAWVELPVLWMGRARPIQTMSTKKSLKMSLSKPFLTLYKRL